MCSTTTFPELAPFNRTRVELKRAKYQMYIKHIQAFNRTRVELKRAALVSKGYEVKPFNRTRVELKRAGKYLGYKFIIHLIVPEWN